MSFIGNTPTQQAFTPAIDYFNGTGSQTVFTLSRPVASAAQVQVNVNNVAQNPSTAFTVLNSTITFTGAPSTGTNNIYVEYTSPITQVIQPGQGTVMPTSLATDGTFQFPSISYTGTLTGNGGIVNIGSGQIYKDASGNLGIGTSSPSQILEVSKSQNGETQIKVVNTNTGSSARAALVLGNNTSSSAGGLLLNGSATTSLGGANSLNIYQGLTAPITFFTDGSERARIDSSGNLLVGTTASAGLGAKIQAKAASSGTALETFDSSGNQLCAFRDNGFAYIPPAYNKTTASVANVFVGSSGDLYRSISALKYKQDVRSLESIDISKFRAVRYKSKCENDDQTVDHFGFIADEADSAGFTELVVYDENNQIEGFKYDRMTAVLLKSLQELKAELDAAKAIITTLTGRLTALEAK